MKKMCFRACVALREKLFGQNLSGKPVPGSALKAGYTMIKISTRINCALVCLACSVFLIGCVQTQYEKAAKEWCTAIRACQMIPVYPLSQDIRPGDIFLVQNSIGQQAREYKKWGFLSLDDLRMRLPLDPPSFSNMYFNSYFKSDITPPCNYPTIALPTTEILSGGAQVATSLTTTQVARVAFPTYSFTVNKGESLAFGVPVSSIPVALNFLGAQKSSASVTLANASTYQADHETIMQKVRLWVGNPQVQKELKAACNYVGKDYVFLRVIKRVYLVGAVDVTIERIEKNQVGVQAGFAESVADPQVSEETFQTNITKQTKLLTQLSALATSNKMGGSVSFNSATSRHVGLRESFDRPLVVGYLGIDVPFFKDGRLGAPIPTFERLKLSGQFVDPKPIELDQLCEVTLLFKATINFSETRQRAVIAAEEFCRKIGGDFESTGKVAQKIKDDLAKGVPVSEKDIEDFARKLITEINYQSTIGTKKEENRQRYREELLVALRNQGI